MKIVFFGTSTFAARILAKLLKSGHSIAAIVTRQDRPRGRSLQNASPPVKEIALSIAPNIPIFQPLKASAPEFAEILRDFDADLFVVVAYGEIIKQNLLDMPKHGAINIHASLLPKYRGAAPIHRCIMDGEEKTGITIIQMSNQMDAGDVLGIKEIPLTSDMTFGELEPELCNLGGDLLLEVIEQLQVGKIKKIPQDHSLATMAPKLSAADEVIDWTKSSHSIHNQIRAFSPSPGASCFVQINGEKKRLKIKRSSLLKGENGPPGAILSMGKEGWIVACGEGALRLREVQLEGKKTLSAEEFIQGIRGSLTFI